MVRMFTIHFPLRQARLLPASFAEKAKSSVPTAVEIGAIEVYMLRNIIQFAVISLCGVGMTMPQAQAQPATNLYQIISGDYVECCGIAGPFHYILPDGNQLLVLLVVDPTQLRAQMTILGEGAEPVYHTFTDGRVYADYIEFGLPGPFTPFPGMEQLHYIVSNSAAGLRFSGIRVVPPFGADVPNRFTHTNVVAILLSGTPRPTVRVSEVEVCWESVTNRNYQVQYRSSFPTNIWTNLGPSVAGNGTTNCIADKVPLGEPQRFYRVLPAP
jgi:hypothetical protein